MSLIKAFPGLRPPKAYADDVVAPPYDVMSAAEAREMVRERPWSFLHISRPEVDLPEATDPYAPRSMPRRRRISNACSARRCWCRIRIPPSIFIA